MLTKTKKWLVVLVFVFAAVFLAACGGTKEPEKVAPTSIEVFADTYVGEKGVLMGGAKMELSVEVVPANADDSVTWSSKHPDIATVDAEGKVTGLKPGNATIVATSTKNNEIKGEIVVRVYEDLVKAKVLFNAMQFIKENTPAYVAESFTFPSYSNPGVSASYYDEDGIKLANNRYTYDYDYDTIEQVKCELSYEGEKVEFILTLSIVDDVVVNEFTAIEAAKEQVATYLSKYANVTGDFDLPLSLAEVYALNKVEKDFGKEVSLDWSSSMNAILKVVETKENDEVVSAKIGYYRPFDDNEVTLEIYYVCGGVTAVSRHKLNAKGYSQAEKMALIIADSLPKNGVTIEGENLNLPNRDKQFGAKIEWTSANAAVLSAKGKMDPYLDAETTVKLTAKVTYKGLTAAWDFIENVEINVVVKPAANDAQSVILDLSNKFDEDENFPFYFPWGLADRVGGNVIPLPTKVGGDGPHKEAVITWTAGEAGVFNDSWELQKQYLRYYPVTMTYSVTAGGATASGELNINIGIAEMQNTIYLGGRYASRSDLTNPVQRFDELHTFAVDDLPFTEGTNVGSYATAYRSWTGFTFYYDLVDEDSGEATRYQYFANDAYTYYVVEAPAGSANGVQFDAEGNMTGKILSVKGLAESNYQFMVLINMTEHDVKIPIAYLNYKGSSVARDINGKVLGRQTTISFDGWRSAFIANADGEVIFGSGGSTPIETYLIDNAEKDDEGNYTLPEYLVIPAGGFAWDPFTSQNKDMGLIGGMFCKEGNILTHQQFTPKYTFSGETLYNPYAK